MNPNDRPNEDQPHPTEEEREEMMRGKMRLVAENVRDYAYLRLMTIESEVQEDEHGRMRKMQVQDYDYIKSENIDDLRETVTMIGVSDSSTWLTQEEYEEDVSEQVSEEI